MLEKAVIIAMIVNAIYYTMLEGEVFAKFGVFFYNVLPEKVHPAVFECNVCMCPWYGALIYGFTWGWSWFIIPTVVAALGVNYTLNRILPC